MVAAAWALALPVAVPPGPVAIDFDGLPAGTVITDQYADAGGPEQGVVFGPLPGGADSGLTPVIRTPPAGQAFSGANVADIATCIGCEFFTPRTTATFRTPRSRVSVRVGYLGTPGFCPDAVIVNLPACAEVTLRAYDANGRTVASSAPARVRRGDRANALLAVSTPTAAIVGFEITGRPSFDQTKQIAIDDLTFSSPPGPTSPDFTLSAPSGLVTIEQGASANVAVTIGRLAGSTGEIAFEATGALPPGLHASFTPNPTAGTATTLTVSADPGAPTRTVAPVTLTFAGTPRSATAGSAARTLKLDVVVKPVCRVVRTLDELVAAIKAAFTCIEVADDARIDLADAPSDPVHFPALLHIPAGVTLRGNRSPTIDGGRLFMSHAVPELTAMLSLGSGATVTGLRLRGYNLRRDTTDRKDRTDAIRVGAVQAVTTIENNEISEWPNAGVEIVDAGTGTGTADLIRVTRNFMHHNVQCGGGYGVAIGTSGYAEIDHNVFAFNRHDVADDGQPRTGYIATLNFALASGPTCDNRYNQHFDMHGTSSNGKGSYDGGNAGGYVEIRKNAIHGAQSYGFLGHLTRPAFELRGTPTVRAIFSENVVAHGDEFEAIRIKGVGAPEGYPPPPLGPSSYLKRKRLLEVRDNRYGVDTSAELAVGDFDGDGHADVFQATGALWAWSPGGEREWHVLNDSSLRLSRLGFGDFDGNGTTDVFSQSGGSWRVSLGGRSAWQALPAGSSIPSSSYRFGDFDGDGRTDVFRANGTRFLISSRGATSWLPLAASRLGVGSLRFGDFDADGKTDVFSLANGRWSVSFGGTSSWRRLNAQLSSDLAALRFGDFDGDRRTDIARSRGGTWEVSWGGATRWQRLHGAVAPLAGGLIGDFDGDRRSDVLMVGILRQPLAPDAFRLLPRWQLSSGARGPLLARSRIDMR